MAGSATISYLVDDAGDAVIEAAGEDHDTVITTLASYTLAANVEDLVGLGMDQTLIGNALDNYISGNEGADRMVGRAGDDIYEVNNSGDRTVERADEGIDGVYTALAVYTLAANVEWVAGHSMTGQQLTGNTLDNIVTGARGNDRLFGVDGNDTLVGDMGYIGNDLLDGGAGTDVASYAGASTGVTVTIQAGAQNTGGGGTDTLVSIEGLIGSDFDDALMGDTSDNSLAGGAGDDTLNGLGGNDQLSGDDGDDVLNGGAGNDRLDGGIGTDTLAGGDGDDTLVVSDRIPVLRPARRRCRVRHDRAGFVSDTRDNGHLFARRYLDAPVRAPALHVGRGHGSGRQHDLGPDHRADGRRPGDACHRRGRPRHADDLRRVRERRHLHGARLHPLQLERGRQADFPSLGRRLG